MNLVEHYLALCESANEIPSFDEAWACADFSDLELADDFLALDDNEFIEYYAASHGMDPDDVYPSDSKYMEWVLQNPVKEKIRLDYDSMVAEYKHGIPCYRAIFIKHGVDPVHIEKVGIYWSIDRNGAQAYWNELMDGNEVTFVGVVDTDNIDWYGTMCARLTPHYAGEFEVRFKKGSRIFVKSIIVNGNETIEINDWRIC